MRNASSAASITGTTNSEAMCKPQSVMTTATAA
jgi:hypothetical protein